MTSKPANTLRVSVVVCVHNEEKWLGKCLQALLRQTYDPSSFEIIVVDDESSDGSPGIARSVLAEAQGGLIPVTYIRIPRGGLAIARNVGIRAASGDIVAFIDGDAIASAGWLTKLVEPLAAGADFVGGRIDLLNAEAPVARFAQLTRHMQVLEPGTVINGLVGCNMAYRTAVFASVGGFYENFTSRGDETSLFQRIQGKFRYAPAPGAVVYHERPDRIVDWVRTEWRAAMLYGLTRKAAAEKSAKRVLASLEETGFAMTPVSALLTWQMPALFAPLLAMSLVCALRRLLFRPASSHVIKGMVPEYGCARSVAGYILFAYLTTVIASIGRPLGIMLHRNDRLVAAFTTNPNPLMSLRAGPVVGMSLDAVQGKA